MKTLDILYQSSSAYTPISAVSILSLLENNRDIDVLKLWFIDDNLNDSDKNFS